MAFWRKLSQSLALLRYGPTRLDEAAAQSVNAEAMAGALEGRLARLAAQVDELAADLKRDISGMRDQVGALAAGLDRAGTAQVTSSGHAVAPSVAAAEEGFYPALERAFRGSEADVRARMEHYRSWIDGLPPGPVADLGCGRGEWLVLLAEWARPAQGVDLNALNVAELRRRGLAAECDDALQWLGRQPDGGFAGLTAFHVIEHLPFAVLLRLVQEARRVLMPGGRLILETPNPENIHVATQTFWLDPTHIRPLPPALVELVARNAGFEVEATLRLNPPGGDGSHIPDAALRAMLMQGRDYAVVARKPLAGQE